MLAHLLKYDSAQGQMCIRDRLRRMGAGKLGAYGVYFFHSRASQQKGFPASLAQEGRIQNQYLIQNLPGFQNAADINIDAEKARKFLSIPNEIGRGTDVYKRQGLPR